MSGGHPMASALASAASERQLLIDDADLLHQCLVSLAGEHNVNLLLKRFQQREAAATAPASKPPDDDDGDEEEEEDVNAISPC